MSVDLEIDYGSLSRQAGVLADIATETPKDFLPQEVKPEVSLGQQFENAAIMNIPGYSELTGDYTRTSHVVDENWNPTGEEAQAIMEEFNVPQSERYSTSSKSQTHLRHMMEKRQRYLQAEQQMAELPLLANIGIQMSTGLLNPVDLVMGGVAGKLLTAPKTIANAIKSTNSALEITKATAKGGLIASATVAPQEYFIQQQHGVYSDERLMNVVGASFLLGGGITGIHKAVTLPTIPVGKQGQIIDEIAELGDVPRAKTSIANYLITSTTNSLALSKNNPIARQIGIQSDTVSVDLRNSDGSLYVQSNETGMGSRYKNEGQFNKLIQQLYKGAKEQGMDYQSYSEKTGRELHEFNARAVNEAERRLATLSEEEVIDLVRQRGITEDIPSGSYAEYYGHARNQLLEQMRTEAEWQVPTHLKPYTDFYSWFNNKGKRLEVDGFKNTVDGFYNHVKFNNKYFKEIGVARATELIYDSMISSPLNAKLMAENPGHADYLKERAKNIADSVIKNDIQAEYKGHRPEGASTATSALKRRELIIDRAKHPELFHTDGEYMSATYADRVGGRLALKEGFGIDRDAGGTLGGAIEAKLQEIRQQGEAVGDSARQINKDVRNAEAVIETVLGSRKFVQNPTGFDTRLSSHLRKSASALYSGGFVKLAVGELGAVIMRDGLRNTLKEFVPAHKKMLDIIDNAKPDDPILKDIIEMGIGGQTLSGQRLIRYDLEEISSSMTRWEEWADKFSHWGRKYSGFNFVTATSDIIGATGFMRKMLKGDVNEKTLARVGLTPDDLVTLKQQPIIYHEGKDIIKDYNFNDWKDQAFAQKIKDAMERQTRDTILRADGTRIHRGLSDVNSPLLQLATQYMHFPAEAFERLMLNGIQEQPARVLVGMMASSMIVGSVLELEDRAEVALGIKDEPMTAEELGIKLYQRQPFLGLAPNVIDYGLMLSGQGAIGTTYRPNDILPQLAGAGGGLVERVFDFSRQVQDDQPFNTKEFDRGFGLSPLNTLIGYEQAVKLIGRGITDE